MGNLTENILHEVTGQVIGIRFLTSEELIERNIDAPEHLAAVLEAENE
jgi:hypothetical protein